MIKVLTLQEKDLPMVVEVHLKAFKGYMNAALGKSYVYRFLHWFLEDPRAIAFCAHYQDRPVGYLVGAQLGYDADLNKKLLSTGIVSILTHPAILFHPQFVRNIKSRLRLLVGGKKTQVTEQFKEPDGIGVSLVGIAADPQSGIKGVGSALMKAFMAEAKVKGYRYTRLSVYEENKVARGLYEKAGWKCLNKANGVLYYYFFLDDNSSEFN